MKVSLVTYILSVIGALALGATATIAVNSAMASNETATFSILSDSVRNGFVFEIAGNEIGCPKYTDQIADTNLCLGGHGLATEREVIGRNFVEEVVAAETRRQLNTYFESTIYFGEGDTITVVLPKIK